MSLLTPDELRELTDCARPSAQIEWLRTHLWVFVVSDAGRPKVDRAEYERHMIGGHRKQTQKKGPDTSWYGQAQKA